MATLVDERTDEWYRNVQEGQRNAVLLRLDTFSLDQVILDSMHGLFLGVTRKLTLDYWKNGKGGVSTPGVAKPYKLLANQKFVINQRLHSIKNKFPKKFQRKV